MPGAIAAISEGNFSGLVTEFLENVASWDTRWSSWLIAALALLVGLKIMSAIRQQTGGKIGFGKIVRL